MENVNILLVDDHPGNLLTYRAILASLNENLVAVGSGREALQRLLQDEFALILLDVVMPDMDGFETAELIRKRPRFEQTPIIFLTAYSASELDRLKAYELGAVDFVFAPIVPEILRAKVSALVELYRIRSELARTNEQLRDEISERKRAQEQLLQSARLAAIGEMVAGLAHESRNALQQIQAAAEMLCRRVRSSEDAQLITEILRSNERIRHLLNQVRNYTAPIKLARRHCDVSRIWQESWKQLQPLREGRQVSFVEEPHAQDVRCFVDPYTIEQLFRNIFENALAASADPACINVHCESSDHNGSKAIRVRVRDHGAGLTDEERARMFEPFFTTKTNGTGLGMAIARRIAEAHHGDIQVGDVEGPGTAIDVFLPRGEA